MPVIDVIIRDNVHKIACNDGEEKELNALAASLNKRVSKLASSFAKANDMQLLLLTALTLEDELNEFKKLHQQLPLNLPEPDVKEIVYVKDEAAVDMAVAQALDAISEYVETLVSKLEK
jgi:cell division protein ZapA